MTFFRLPEPTIIIHFPTPAPTFSPPSLAWLSSPLFSLRHLFLPSFFVFPLLSTDLSASDATIFEQSGECNWLQPFQVNARLLIYTTKPNLLPQLISPGPSTINNVMSNKPISRPPRPLVPAWTSLDELEGVKAENPLASSVKLRMTQLPLMVSVA